MDRTKGLSESERRELLARIESLLGATPKGKLVKKLVEALPGPEAPPGGGDTQTDVPEAD